MINEEKIPKWKKKKSALRGASFDAAFTELGVKIQNGKSGAIMQTKKEKANSQTCEAL